MSIHKEGRTILFVLLVVLVSINFLIDGVGTEETIANLVILASIILYLLVLQFFRNPTVVTSIDENLVYAPADGKVVVVETVKDEEYLKEDRIQISIFMSPINVHVNRAPVSGIVEYFRYHKGKYLVAWHPKSSVENERTTMVIKIASGAKVLVRQIAGAVARRIKWYVKEGEKVVQGEEFGFIKFGSRLDVLLPVDADLKVTVGEKTKAGRTILARISGPDTSL